MISIFLGRYVKLEGDTNVFYILLYTFIAFHYLKGTVRGAWVIQLVKLLSLGFSSDCDLRVMRLSPALSSVLGMESA